MSKCDDNDIIQVDEVECKDPELDSWLIIRSLRGLTLSRWSFIGLLRSWEPLDQIEWFSSNRLPRLQMLNSVLHTGMRSDGNEALRYSSHRTAQCWRRSVSLKAPLAMTKPTLLASSPLPGQSQRGSLIYLQHVEDASCPTWITSNCTIPMETSFSLSSSPILNLFRHYPDMVTKVAWLPWSWALLGI